ncbi:hypothetical protein GOBAR_AA14515 [Gossypium barbadense]|uniref:Uncharacterized protein n=1 Tax=Gossypium barbadense TaxID=3634 RepID=A0A2P5XS06_GOSBA|nr:hypothetical protein GOBAR_AA14515 [Gossypium barbadense]
MKRQRQEGYVVWSAGRSVCRVEHVAVVALEVFAARRGRQGGSFRDVEVRVYWWTEAAAGVVEANACVAGVSDPEAKSSVKMGLGRQAASVRVRSAVVVYAQVMYYRPIATDRVTGERRSIHTLEG